MDKQYVKLDNGKCKCLICNKEYSIYGIGSHIWKMHGEGRNHDPNAGYKKGRIIWNKGLTKDTDERVKRCGETLTKHLKEGLFKHHSKNTELTKEHKQKISDKINERIKNGEWHTSFSKKNYYEYNGIKLQVKWEYLYAKYLDENNIKWERPYITFEYEYEGKTRRYRPDFFLLDEKIYIEIKGYVTLKDLAKWNNFPCKLKILIDEDLINLNILKDFQNRKQKIEFKKEYNI